MWDLPGPGLEPVSPALAGGFSTTAPPGKPWLVVLKKSKEASVAGATEVMGPDRIALGSPCEDIYLVKQEPVEDPKHLIAMCEKLPVLPHGECSMGAVLLKTKEARPARGPESF